jgi:hypothetical protein
MNQKTAKMIRSYGVLRLGSVKNARYRDAKRNWNSTPRPKRYAIRLVMEKALMNAQ